MVKKYDLVVVGGGTSGLEAAKIAAQNGLRFIMGAVGLLKNSYERHYERQSLEAISVFALLFLTFLDSLL